MIIAYVHGAATAVMHNYSYCHLHLIFHFEPSVAYAVARAAQAPCDDVIRTNI